MSSARHIKTASATAFAPAGVGNVAVGFDLLGHALEAVGDRVTVSRLDRPVVEILAIRGCDSPLPMEPERNTATAGPRSARAEAIQVARSLASPVSLASTQRSSPLVPRSAARTAAAIRAWSSLVSFMTPV